MQVLSVSFVKAFRKLFKALKSFFELVEDNSYEI
jgi:hypothetical protein